MARPINCDLCPDGAPAQILMTQLQTGDTLGICPSCAPLYLTLLRNQVCDILYGAHPDEAPLQDLLEAQDHEQQAGEEPGTSWPHTKHNIRPGQRKRKADRETVAEHQQAAEADAIDQAAPSLDPTSEPF